MGQHERDARATKPPRASWTLELHSKFESAVQSLGGIGHAMPVAIMEEMGVPGLTREQVKSHLQRYKNSLRTASSSAPSATDASSGQDGEVWWPTQHYSVCSLAANGTWSEQQAHVQMPGLEGGGRMPGPYTPPFAARMPPGPLGTRTRMDGVAATAADQQSGGNPPQPRVPLWEPSHESHPVHPPGYTYASIQQPPPRTPQMHACGQVLPQQHGALVRHGTWLQPQQAEPSSSYCGHHMSNGGMMMTAVGPHGAIANAVPPVRALSGAAVPIPSPTARMHQPAGHESSRGWHAQPGGGGAGGSGDEAPVCARTARRFERQLLPAPASWSNGGSIAAGHSEDLDDERSWCELRRIHHELTNSLDQQLERARHHPRVRAKALRRARREALSLRRGAWALLKTCQDLELEMICKEMDPAAG